jgi:hypothetical protein
MLDRHGVFGERLPRGFEDGGQPARPDPGLKLPSMLPSGGSAGYFTLV